MIRLENKDSIISVMRGIAIILVVYGHFIQRTLSVYGVDFYLNPIFKLIYTFHMPLFVFLSGYLMAHSLNRKNIGDVFKSRCKSLLVPFLSWGILGVLTLLALGKINSLMENLPIWFIWFLFTLFMSSILLLCSIELEKKWGMIAFLLVYLGLMFIPYNSFCSLYYVQWFYLFYLAGYFLNKKRLAIKKKSIHAVIFFISLILFVLLASYWTKGDYIYINQMNFLKVNYFAESLRWIYRYAVAFLGITVVFYIAKALSKTRIRESLEMIGVFSLDIYLIQRYIVEGLYPRLLSKMPADFYVPFFLWPLLVLFFVGLCMTISKLLIRKNVLLTQVLLGGRV